MKFNLKENISLALNIPSGEVYIKMYITANVFDSDPIVAYFKIP